VRLGLTRGTLVPVFGSLGNSLATLQGTICERKK